MSRNSIEETVKDFLAQKRIAVVGVSRNSRQTANGIYRTLRGMGYEVKPVNPKTTEAEGDPCYPDLASIPGGVDAVLAVTLPKVTETVARDCVALGIPRLWMHRSFGPGSVSEEAARYCRDNGVAVIAGGCPMMYRQGADIFHRCMRVVLKVTGGLFSEERAPTAQ